VPVSAEPVSAHRVNDLYYQWLQSRGRSRFWRQRGLGGEGELPRGWRGRFGLAAGHANIWEATLRR
jgi:hypothetical protein